MATMWRSVVDADEDVPAAGAGVFVVTEVTGAAVGVAEALEQADPAVAVHAPASFGAVLVEAAGDGAGPAGEVPTALAAVLAVEVVEAGAAHRAALDADVVATAAGRQDRARAQEEGESEQPMQTNRSHGAMLTQPRPKG